MTATLTTANGTQMFIKEVVTIHVEAGGIVFRDAKGNPYRASLLMDGKWEVDDAGKFKTIEVLA